MTVRKQQFGECQYRTVDFAGNILEVTHLRDIFDRPTQEPLLAERCVVRVGNQLIAMSTDECPIYTVH